MNRSVRRAKSVKRFERSNGLDAALYKTTFTFFFTQKQNILSAINTPGARNFFLSMSSPLPRDPLDTEVGTP